MIVFRCFTRPNGESKKSQQTPMFAERLLAITYAISDDIAIYSTAIHCLFRCPPCRQVCRFYSCLISQTRTHPQCKELVASEKGGLELHRYRHI